MLQTTDRRQTTDVSAIAYNEHEHEFTFANITGHHEHVFRVNCRYEIESMTR